MRKDLTASITAIIVFTLVLGLAYPLLTTGVAQVLFPNKADGSQVERDGEVVGSRLIGQDFKRPVMRNGEPVEDEEGEPVLEADPAFFQSRPSVTGYDSAGTFFNNLGPNNKELAGLFEENLTAYLELERPYNPGLQRGDVPVDAVTTSASGVDPHISEANAAIQARRVAEERGLGLERVQELIDENTDGRGFGVLGEPGVNVLELNLAITEERPEADQPIQNAGLDAPRR
jgi:potassium-transporting ATPase KdpC subunit